MDLASALVFVCLIGFTGFALFAFGWAARHRQFRDFDAGARSIFDADEPIGASTDEFPGRPDRRENSAGIHDQP
jgi:cbb3-type cytochrome oxidase maturation protein